MKYKLLGIASIVAIIAGSSVTGETKSNEIKLGVLFGFTGPIESMAVHMVAGVEIAVKEINASSLLLNGSVVKIIRADSTCIDAAVGTAAAERLVTSDKVNGIIGAACSGITSAVLANVALPNGMVMISPSSTSPALSTVKDDGLFFRTAPSDARQSAVMSDILIEQGITKVAVTYTNNDYGKGISDSFQTAFEAAGGTVTINIAHEDGKADYSAEIGALASAGGQRLVVAGYADQGGSGIVRAALDSGAFDTFHFPDGMASAALEKNFGSEIDGSTGQYPSAGGKGADLFSDLVGKAFDPSAIFAPESYDATALILLAMQAAGSSDPKVYKTAIMGVANAPGEKILPGELDKALKILADGGDIDYVGATSIELIGGGEATGAFREFEIKDGKMATIGFR